MKKSRLNRYTELESGLPPARKTGLTRTRFRAGAPVHPLEDAHPSSSGPTKAKRRRDTGPSKAVRDLVKARANLRCENCPFSGMDVHHRRPRGAGGSSDAATNQPSNLVFLCRECHAFFESHRERALAHGWLVRQGADPASVPVLIAGRWVLLTDDGQYQAIPEREAS